MPARTLVVGDTAAVQIAGRLPPQFSARYGTVDEKDRPTNAVLTSS
jgi:hypothetical protein